MALGINILAFIGTFLTISGISILVLKYAIVGLFNKQDSHKTTKLYIIIIGIIIAIVLIPLYNLPF